MEHDTAGGPITGIPWTHKTPAGIAELLRQLDIEISANTVARLLHDMDFSLRVNRKAIATDSSPDRDQQFRYISSLLPASSVRAAHHQRRYQKRELVGNFKNNGVKWDRTSVRVNDHDFRSDAMGVAIPYGIYDLLANRGSVFVGVSHDRAAFAVHSIASWWKRTALIATIAALVCHPKRAASCEMTRHGARFLYAAFLLVGIIRC